jgi:predicted kinase
MQNNSRPILIIFAGLPATGKTAIARELARRLSAVYLRLDSIEQAIRASRTENGALNAPIYDEGYRAAYALADDNLRLGRTVVADSVNPLEITRDAWLTVARRANTPPLEVEVICSDPKEHQRRVESRVTDIPGLKLPTWRDVQAREYHPWTRDRVQIDTAILTVEESVAKLQELIQEMTGRK